MKIKNKIAVTLIPLGIVTIVFINILFGLFFQKTIDRQETNRVYSAQVNIDTFINEQKQKLLGIAYDWGRWDDTYSFIETNNSDYIRANLSENSFSNINLNFMMFADSKNVLVNQRYFSLTNSTFTDFPAGFLDDFNTVMVDSTPLTDISGIFRFGENFFLVASTYITDSEEIKPSNGRITVGKRIDEHIIEKIEEISGCSILSLDIVDISADSPRNDELTILVNSYISQSKDDRIIELIRPNTYDLKSSVKLTLSLPRDLILSDIREMAVFALINTAISVIGSVIMLWILSRYLSKPIAQLVDDIKSIDIAKTKLSYLT